MKRFFNIQNLFVIVCLFWGLLFTVITPALQAPDELEHLFKMWGYTDGCLTYKVKDGWVGNNLPTNFVKMYHFYNQYRWSYEKIPMNETKYISTWPLDKTQQTFLKYNAPVYTPLSYFPAFLVLWVLKLLNIAPLLMTYLMRICFLLLYTALGYFAIKITPCKKWMFFLMLTLPMMLSQAASINTDGLFFGLIFIFYAYTLKLKFDENIEKITNKHISIWGGMSVLICILKFAYLPLILLYFLIPKEKTEIPKNYLKNFFIICAANVAIVVFFLSGVMGAEGHREWMYKNHNRSNFVVAKEILSHPFEYLYMIFYTTKKCMDFYLENMISNIGVLMSTIPAYATNLYWFLLFLSAFYTTKKEEAMCICKNNKLILCAMILITYVLVLTSVYVVYQTQPIIKGVQGRYLTPVLPAFLLLFMCTKFNVKNKFIPWLIFLVSQFLLVVTIAYFIIRFY